MFVKHLETSQKLVDLSIKEVVLTAELLSSVRALLKSRRISIFFEGQTQDEKQVCGSAMSAAGDCTINKFL